MLAIIMFAWAGCSGCALHTLPSGGAGAVHLVSAVVCAASPTARTVTCAPGGRDARGSEAAAVELIASGVHYDSVAQTFGFDARLKNRSGNLIGTTTGRDVSGLKVFIENGPTVTSFRSPADTGTVVVSNPDGRASFTRPRQPYFFYAARLEPDSAAPARHWDLHCPPTVATFRFTVRVFTRTPAAPGIASAVMPVGFLIPHDSVELLYSPDRQIRSHPRAAGPYPRDLLEVIFALRVSADEVQSALDLIDGHVIGGDGAGCKVLISGDSTGEPLWSAIDRLRALPTVMYAGPDLSLLVREASSLPGDRRREFGVLDAGRVPSGFWISDDSLGALFRRDRVIYSHPRGSGGYPRDLLLVGFTASSTAAERRAAIDAVHGRVIGGDGSRYSVLIPDDPTGNGLWSAIDRLRSLRFVRYAGPDHALNIQEH
jgi:hypothetical protein